MRKLYVLLFICALYVLNLGCCGVSHTQILRAYSGPQLPADKTVIIIPEGLTIISLDGHEVFCSKGSNTCKQLELLPGHHSLTIARVKRYVEIVQGQPYMNYEFGHDGNQIAFPPITLRHFLMQVLFMKFMIHSKV